MTVLDHGVSVQVVTVLLVDATPVIRDGIRFLLADEPDVRVVAEAVSAREAVQLASRLRPDVIVADLPDLALMSGQVRTYCTAVLAFTDIQDDRTVMTAIRAGVRGYLPKTSTPEDLIRAIRSVAVGQAVFGAHVANRVTELLFHRPAEQFPGLTRREREILDLLAQGMSNAAIAYQLHVTPKTIRNHASGIFAKLGVSTRAAAIVAAHAAGLGRPDHERSEPPAHSARAR
jgi:DNA-binding NarL/FixJ family response regulator